jgi:hypothetical protein
VRSSRRRAATAAAAAAVCDPYYRCFASLACIVCHIAQPQLVRHAYTYDTTTECATLMTVHLACATEVRARGCSCLPPRGGAWSVALAGASSIALTAVSATSDTSPLLVTRLTLQVHPAKGRLSSSSSSTTSSRPQAVSRHPAGM